MGGHLAAVTLAFPLREIIQGQLARSDAAAEDEGAIPIIRHDIIAIDQGDAERRETFVAHSGNVEMSFALAIEILLAQIAVPALEQDREQTQFLFFAERGHVGSRDGLSKRANTQLARGARQVVATPLCRRDWRDSQPRVFTATERRRYN